MIRVKVSEIIFLALGLFFGGISSNADAHLPAFAGGALTVLAILLVGAYVRWWFSDDGDGK